jgi:hypothetical protein
LVGGEAADQDRRDAMLPDSRSSSLFVKASNPVRAAGDQIAGLVDAFGWCRLRAALAKDPRPGEVGEGSSLSPRVEHERSRNNQGTGGTGSPRQAASLVEHLPGLELPADQAMVKPRRSPPVLKLDQDNRRRGGIEARNATHGRYLRRRDRDYPGPYGG